MIEIVAGLALLVALAMVLVYAAGLRQRSAKRLQDQRHALEAARLTLTQLQLRQPSAIDPDAAVRVVREGPRVGEMEWAEVSAAVGRGKASISGLVPTTSPATQPGGTP
jgi:type II secretory pathway pseudopilin PulG